jgi:hypothetical protein
MLLLRGEEEDGKTKNVTSFVDQALSPIATGSKFKLIVNGS